MSVRRASATGAAGLLALGLAACESSQTESARLERQGAKAAVIGTVSAGARNPSVKVVDTTLLRSEMGTAAVVELENTGPATQVAVPIQIDVKDAKGASLYKNDVDGLQPALQQLALLRRGTPAIWVNDQVTAPTKAKRLAVQVGRAEAAAPGALPEIRLEKTRMDSDSSGALATGVVRNLSKIRQVNMPIYGVVRRGGRIVAAGRAIIERLNPEPQSRPTVFRIFFIGDPTGGKLDVVPVPTVLKEGG